MESKKFDTYSNPYTAFTPLTEQINGWLELHPNIQIKDLQINERDAILIYETTD